MRPFQQPANLLCTLFPHAHLVNLKCSLLISTFSKKSFPFLSFQTKTIESELLPHVIVQTGPETLLPSELNLAPVRRLAFVFSFLGVGEPSHALKCILMNVYEAMGITLVALSA